MSCLFSVVILTAGIIYIGGETAFGLLLVMISGYMLTTALMTPRLRFASAQKLRTREAYTQAFFESFSSVRDIKLVKAEDFFHVNLVSQPMNTKALTLSCKCCQKSLAC